MNNSKFVKAYVWAYKNDKTSLDIAKRLGVEVKQVYGKANSLRKRGVKLPFLNKESGRELNVDGLNRLITNSLT